MDSKTTLFIYTSLCANAIPEYQAVSQFPSTTSFSSDGGILGGIHRGPFVSKEKLFRQAALGV
ncbi:MAG: hypothetical protein DMG21_15830 [Acidobacteria bacterium]|nr:MAG: hypothetical protein DMG21_15830 [Acidobacteriota bacterium]